MKTRVLLIFSLPFFFLFLSGQTAPPSKSWTAQVQTTVLHPNGHKILFSGKYFQNGSKVRFEPGGSEEIDLYDFSESKERRLFPADRIYFESLLTPARLIKAVIEGWTPAAPQHQERRIFLRNGAFNGKEAALFLITLLEKGETRYALRWVTADESAFPLQVIYPSRGYETVIVHFNDIRTEPFDPALFDPPADYLNLNPF